MFQTLWSADVCLHSLTGSVSCDAEPPLTFCEEEKIMGKGNNSQKNDKKNKKPKKDSKTAPSKPASSK